MSSRRRTRSVGSGSAGLSTSVEFIGRAEHDRTVETLIEPMLAKLTDAVPLPDRVEGGLSYEPKWDGFRGIVYFDGTDVEIGSRGSKLLTRYFPELAEMFRARLSDTV